MKSLTLSLTCLCLLLISADARTFTNTEGRRIEAEIVSVSGTQVTLKLAQGATAIFEIAKLSAADQTFVKAWRPPATSSGKKDEPAKGGVFLAVGAGGCRTRRDSSSKMWPAAPSPVVLHRSCRA